MSVRLTTVLWRPVRLGWRRLISMRTALVLLFLLAVAAVPASLLPQRPLNANSTRAYLASHGAWGQLLNHTGAFDVFGSVWFAAIYLLLLISLIGCLIPRIRAHYRAARSRPPRTPRHLDSAAASRYRRRPPRPARRCAATAWMSALPVTSSRSRPRRATCARPAT
jgi:cytochrome c biogenesis protein